MRFLSQTMLKIMFLAICWFVFSCISNNKLFDGKSPCAILDLSLPPVGIVHPQSRCIMWMELKNDLAQKLIWNSRSVAFKVSIRFYAMLLSPTLVSYTIMSENIIFHCVFWESAFGLDGRDASNECLTQVSVWCMVYFWWTASHVKSTMCHTFIWKTNTIVEETSVPTVKPKQRFQLN